jgi:hypothetical protein
VCNVNLRSNVFAFSLVSTQTVFQNDGGHVEVMSRGRLSHWHMFFFLFSPPLSSSCRPNTQEHLYTFPALSSSSSLPSAFVDVVALAQP